MLEIISVTPTANVDGYKTAGVVSSWGNLSIRYKLGQEEDRVLVHEIHADLSELNLPAGSNLNEAGPKWVAAVAKKILSDLALVSQNDSPP